MAVTVLVALALSVPAAVAGEPPDGAVFKPIVSHMPSPGFLLAAGATAALLLRGIARLLRR